MDESSRRRLSAGATKSFLDLMMTWGIGDDDACALAGVDIRLLQQMRTADGVLLEEESLRRIAYLTAIHRGLHGLYGPQLADRWIKMPNSNPLFGGLSPVAFLARGGLPAFDAVRRLVDPKT